MHNSKIIPHLFSYLCSLFDTAVYSPLCSSCIALLYPPSFVLAVVAWHLPRNPQYPSVPAPVAVSFGIFRHRIQAFHTSVLLYFVIYCWTIFSILNTFDFGIAFFHTLHKWVPRSYFSGQAHFQIGCHIPQPDRNYHPDNDIWCIESKISTTFIYYIFFTGTFSAYSCSSSSAIYSGLLTAVHIGNTITDQLIKPSEW